jgi:mRNA-degrading endonuclease YafQ of YafQ-DinJ toxin-antitoxin module
MNIWKIDFEIHVPEEMAADFKAGKLSSDDIKVLKRWVNEVETKGLTYAQNNKDWRDHTLMRGKWKGHRAISFSFSGRLIYRAEEKRLFVLVVRVTPEHDYF